MFPFLSQKALEPQAQDESPYSGKGKTTMRLHAAREAAQRKALRATSLWRGLDPAGASGTSAGQADNNKSRRHEKPQV